MNHLDSSSVRTLMATAFAVAALRYAGGFASIEAQGLGSYRLANDLTSLGDAAAHWTLGPDGRPRTGG